MDRGIEQPYQSVARWASASSLDLSRAEFLYPIEIIESCLLLARNSVVPNRTLVLPTNPETLHYLERMHLDVVLHELGYREQAEQLQAHTGSERDAVSFHEILHCVASDAFSARLGRFERMFHSFGLDDDLVKRATVLIGELGNNAFDHNLGNWPTNVSGVFIAAQNYSKLRRVEVAVGDPGVGFRVSLHNAFPDISNDVEAIKKGLAGFTGRVGEKRGNGLKVIQHWTVDNFSGTLTIRSGNGLVRVSRAGIESTEVGYNFGTTAQLVLNY